MKRSKYFRLFAGLTMWVWTMGALSAATPLTGTTIDFKLLWPTNSLGVSTNAIFEVENLPSMAPSNRVLEVVVFGLGSDGAGKIEGQAFMRVGFDGSQTNYADLLLYVFGTLGNKSGNPSISLTLNGTGRAQSFSQHGNASCSLKYSGTVTQGVAEVVSAGYVVTVTTNEATGITSTNILGYETNSPLINPPDTRVPAGTNWVVAYYTNSISQTNFPVFVAGGNYDGTISTSLGVKIPRWKKSPGKLTTGVTWVPDQSGTNLVPSIGSQLTALSLDIFGSVVRIGNKTWLGGFAPISFNGTGGMNDTKLTYNANLKGLGFSRNSSLTVSGSSAVATNFIVVAGNPPITNLVQVFFPASGTASGKIKGQKVSITGGLGFPR